MENNIQNNQYYKYKKQYSPWKGVTVTKSARKRILQLITESSNILGLKITIKKSGCAGFTYKLKKVTTLEEKCIIYENNGAKLFIPLEIMPFIDGTELDYIQEGLSYAFKFNNPKVQYSCGCGESFNI